MMLSGKTTKSRSLSFRKVGSISIKNLIAPTGKGSQYFISSRKILIFQHIPSESFFSKVGNVFTIPRNNLSTTTTKMLTIVKDKVTKIRLCDVDLGIKSGDDPEFCTKITWEINDDLDFCAMDTRDINDNSDVMIKHNEDEDRDCNCFGD